MGILLATALSTGFALLQPWPVKLLVDNVIGGAAVTGGIGAVLSALPGGTDKDALLGWVVAGTIVIFALRVLTEATATWGWVRIGQRMVYDVAGDMFARLQRRSLLFHRGHTVGDAMSRISGDSWAVYTLVSTVLVTPAQALVTAIAMSVIMVRLDPGLTAAVLAVAPAMAAGSLLLGGPLRGVGRLQREIQSRMHAHVQQTMAGITLVQAFSREDREHRRFRDFADEAIRAQQRVTILTGLHGLSTGLVSTLGTAIILWLGASRVLAGELTTGTLLVFLAYLASLQESMRSLAGVYTALQTARGSLDRVVEALDATPEIRESPHARTLPRARGHIVFENVTFGYVAPRAVVRHLSMEVRPGQTAAIVGPTGAGKSTLLALVPRLFDPWQGRVTIDGVDVRDVTLASLRNQVAVVPQEPVLFHGTVAENIACGERRASPAAIEAAARTAGAHEFVARLPDGYATLLGHAGSTLSGGERQRLAIARALFRNAPILVLDEPTSALDIALECAWADTLDRMREERTIIIVAHRLSTIERADRIFVMADGEIVESGTHQELLEQPHHYAALCRGYAGEPLEVAR
jgi:ATP-binding cassette subfamily B protein/subfamily B ATP-binding cassette protein MsbA